MEYRDNNDDLDSAKSPPPSPKGRIPVIKIRLAPKKAAEDAAAAAAEEEVKSHYCKECNKSFSSGKALGGHMSSAHVQANMDYSSKKLSSSSSSSKRKASASSFYSNNTCNLCGKSFPSMKSVFGHMRCHPEREWRGMEPPPEMKLHDGDSSPSEEEDDDDSGDGGDKIDSGHELGFSVKNWPTSKRGRGPITTEKKETESFVAGLQLIKMLNGGESRKQGGEGAAVDDDDDGRRRGEIGKEKEKLLVKNQNSETLMSELPDGVDPNDELYITAIQVLVSGKRENEKRLMEEKEAVIISPPKGGGGCGGGGGVSETTTSSPEKFKCNECERFFTTHQALGGHRSSHNKFKMSVVNTSTLDCAAHSEMTTPPPVKTTKRKKREKVVKSSSAAANGNGDDEMQSSSAGRAAAATTAASSSVAAFAFDLNMTPAEEEEDMEDSSHHTSSNYS